VDIVSKAKDFISNQVGVNISTGAPMRRYMPRSQQEDKNPAVVGKARTIDLLVQRKLKQRKDAVSMGLSMGNKGVGNSTYTQGGAVHAKMTGRPNKPIPGAGMGNKGKGNSTYTQGGSIHAKMTGRMGK